MLSPVEAVLVHRPLVEPAPPVVKSPVRRRRVLPMEAMLCVLVVESRRRHSWVAALVIVTSIGVVVPAGHPA